MTTPRQRRAASSPGTVPAWTLGWRLQRALAHADMTVYDMADELDRSRATISRWLNDRNEIPKVYLQRWALRTGVNYDWLKDGTLPDGSGPSANSGWSVPATGTGVNQRRFTRDERLLPMVQPTAA